MNIKQADQAILDGTWREIAEALSDACLRYKDSGTILKSKSYILYELWTERAELLKQASEL